MAREPFMFFGMGQDLLRSQKRAGELLLELIGHPECTEEQIKEVVTLYRNISGRVHDMKALVKTVARSDDRRWALMLGLQRLDWNGPERYDHDAVRWARQYRSWKKLQEKKYDDTT